MLPPQAFAQRVDLKLVLRTGGFGDSGAPALPGALPRAVDCGRTRSGYLCRRQVCKGFQAIGERITGRFTVAAKGGGASRNAGAFGSAYSRVAAPDLECSQKKTQLCR